MYLALFYVQTLHRGICIESQLATQMCVKDICTLYKLPFSHHVHQSRETLSLVDGVCDESLRRRSEADGINGLLIGNAVDSAMVPIIKNDVLCRDIILRQSDLCSSGFCDAQDLI